MVRAMVDKGHVSASESLLESLQGHGRLDADCTSSPHRFIEIVSLPTHTKMAAQVLKPPVMNRI